MFKIEDERIKKLFRQFGQMLPADGVNVEDLPQILDKSPISNNAAANTPTSGLFRPVPQTLETNQPSPFAVQNIEQAQPNGLGAAQIQPAQTIAQPQLTETQKLLRPNPSFTPNVADEPNIITLGGYDLDDGQTPANVQQPAVSGQTTTAVQPTTAITNRPRTSADIQAERDALRNTPAERNPSFMQRLGGGLWDAFINWGKTGGGDLGNLAGQLAMGGGASAVSPGFRAEWKKEQKDQRLLRELTEAQKSELNQANLEIAKQKPELEQERLRQTGERLKIAQQRNADSEYDRGFRRTMQKLKLGYKRGANPQLDQELSRYGIEIDQWDDNKRTFWQGQNLMTFDENGNAIPVTNERGEAVTDATRAPVKVTYDGSEFTVTNTVALQSLTNAGRMNTTIANQTTDDLQKWENDIAKNQSVVNKNKPVIESNNRQIQAIKDNKANYDKNGNLFPDVQKQIDGYVDKNAQLQGESDAANREIQRLRNNRPQPRQQTQNPTITGNQPYAGKTYQNPASLRAAFPGLSDSQIRQRVEAGGGRFLE